jgi:hypothetical protein
VFLLDSLFHPYRNGSDKSELSPPRVKANPHVTRAARRSDPVKRQCSACRCESSSLPSTVGTFCNCKLAQKATLICFNQEDIDVIVGTLQQPVPSCNHISQVTTSQASLLLHLALELDNTPLLGSNHSANKRLKLLLQNLLVDRSVYNVSNRVR